MNFAGKIWKDSWTLTMNVVLMILGIVSGYYNLSVFVYTLDLEDKMPGFCINGLEFFIYWKKKGSKILVPRAFSLYIFLHFINGVFI